MAAEPGVGLAGEHALLGIEHALLGIEHAHLGIECAHLGSGWRVAVVSRLSPHQLSFLRRSCSLWRYRVCGVTRARACCMCMRAYGHVFMCVRSYAGGGWVGEWVGRWVGGWVGGWRRR